MPNAIRRVVTPILILCVLGGGGFAFWRWRESHAKPPVQFDTAKADKGRIIARVTATGTLSALVTVQVGSQVSGRVQKIYVDFNSQVKAGQLIAKIDEQLFVASREQAKANAAAASGSLVKAEAQERDAQRQFERARGLLERKLIAQADYDTAEANLDVAKGQTASARGSLEQAKASLHQAEVNLQYTRIISPTDGVVISRSVDVGQTVAASLQAPTLFVIAQDLRKMQVDTSVAEADIGKLSASMPATFTVDAFSGERFHGTVRQIRNAPQTVQNVVTYDAVIDVANPDLKLRPGMTANVTFVWAEKDDALRVPNAALRFRPSLEIFAALGVPAVGSADAGAAGRGGGGWGSGVALSGTRGGRGGGGARSRGDSSSDRRQVWVMRPDGQAPSSSSSPSSSPSSSSPAVPVPVAVRTGISDGSQTEILEGELRPGDLVVVDATVSGQSTTAPAAGPGAPGGMRRIF